MQLRDFIINSAAPHGIIAAASHAIALGDLIHGTTLDADIEHFRGKSVLIKTISQLAAATAIIALDGIARRITLAPPDLASADLPAIMEDAEIGIILSDQPEESRDHHTVCCGMPLSATSSQAVRDQETEWLLFTSGTTSRPKMAVHTLASLAGPLRDHHKVMNSGIWSTFYDIRRYGGMQILLRALAGGGSMILSDIQENIGDFLIRAGAQQVSHISGTPSHWRHALMSPQIHCLAPDYIRLSGEITDQTILNSLYQAFPNAKISHAFATTEAGVAFDVTDGRAGFPAILLQQQGSKVEMKLQNGSLHIRSPYAAKSYASTSLKLAMDEDGFIDTGDMLACQNGRYYFSGRREGLINVGGLKVHPEEVEAVVNLHPAVQMSRVQGRPSPITGAIVVANIVVRANYGGAASFNVIRNEILGNCRRLLPMYKVPAMLSQVARLDISAAGKLLRSHA
jgi:acyl-CoA synthetase (AMP-forming)/AMP-acid ligase II